MNILKKIKARRELMQAHRESLAVAQKYYDRIKDGGTVISEWDGDGYSAVSAAGPEREAWDRYCDEMHKRGKNHWDAGYKRFDRELKE